jgi:hypothetical protein
LTGGIAVTLPTPGLYLGSALAMIAVATGVLAYRRRRDRSGSRLAGVAGAIIAGFAIVLGVTRYTVILAALDRLEHLFL